MSSFFQRGISFLLSLEERVLPYLKKPGVRVVLIALSTLGGIFLQRAPAFAQATIDPIMTDRLFLFIADFAIGIAGMIGQLIVALLEVVTIPIMQYNGFVSSPVVGAGWSIVRDTVNMFFVLVLVAIAVGTIFGSDRFQWRQQVVRLMVFAIVINFSRTLCGLMIDVAQVIMLTFANALKDIAGGNFIQVFGLKDLISISTSSDRMQALAGGAGEQALNAFDYFTAGVMSVFLMLIVFVVVLMLTAILVYRIVALWVLIVIAPLAWFLGGAKGVVSSDAYAEWWKNFKCYLLIGPVLTFFVWLTLAVAGAGNIANSAGFTSGAVLSSGADTNVVGGALKIFEVSRLTSYIIGIALMFAGFDAAQKMCAGVKSASFVNNRIDQARGSVGAIGYGGAGAAAYVGAKGLGLIGAGAGKVSRNAAASVQNSPLDILTRQGRARRARNASKATNSPFFARVAGTYADSLEKAHTEEVKGSAEGYFDEMGKGSKVQYLAAMAQSGQSFDQDERNRAMVLFGEMIGDPGKRKALEEQDVVIGKNLDGSPKTESALKKLYRDFGAENLKTAFAGDGTLSHNLHALDESRPDIGGHADHIDTIEDVRKLDKAALADEAVRARLKTIASGKTDKDGVGISAYDEIANGGHGAEKKKALDLPPPPPPPPPVSVRGTFMRGEGLDLATSRFSDDAARRSFSAVIRGNPEQIMDIDGSVFTQNGHDNDVARTAGAALTQPAISRLLEQYATAPDDAGRARVAEMLDRVDKALEAAGAVSVDDKKFTQLRTKTAAAKARMDARRTGVPLPTPPSSTRGAGRRGTAAGGGTTPTPAPTPAPAEDTPTPPADPGPTRDEVREISNRITEISREIQSRKSMKMRLEASASFEGDEEEKERFAREIAEVDAALGALEGERASLTARLPRS